MARAHGRGSTTPTIPIGTVRGRRADAVSFALAVLSSLAQAWAVFVFFCILVFLDS